MYANDVYMSDNADEFTLSDLSAASVSVQ